MGISKKEWRINVNKDQPFEWKGESSSEYLWNEDLYKAHTSGTPSDEQVAISGKDGAGDIDRDPQQLDLENSFNSGSEMGSVTENPTVKPRMLNPKKKRGSGAKKIEKFGIKQESKIPHPRPVITPKGIPVSLLNKAINILSAPIDETDVADDIRLLLKNWQDSGYEAEDNFENTNWEPRERSKDNSVASVDPDNRELDEGEADGVDENLGDVLSDEASKAVVDLAKKNMRVAKKISNEAVEEAEDKNTSEDTSDIAQNGTEPNAVMDSITLQKQLAMGHGRCPHKNQIDLCEKCGDMEMKQEDNAPNGNQEPSIGEQAKTGFSGGQGTGAAIGRMFASSVEKGTRHGTRKVRKNLEETAEHDLDDNLEESSYDTKMGSLMKALEDVEVQLAVETNDYDVLMKALGSQIQKLSSR